MENNLNISVTEGLNEVTVLHGHAEPVYHKKAIDVRGATVVAVAEYLQKKVVDDGFIEHSKIEYSYDGLYIKLHYAARERNTDVIEGVLKIHPDLEKFKINSGKAYNTFELAEFIKMNRHYFENKEYAMKLVSELRGFEGKVHKELENKVDDRANKKVYINQVVESNIPSNFYIEVPVFVGHSKKRIEIEVTINASFECFLISPELKEFVDQESEIILGGQIEEIRAMHPELKIFEV